MREEIESVIGDEVPTIEHKANCHLVNAFVVETMRYRTVVPLGVPHRALVDSNIRGFAIAKDTSVMLHANNILHDPKHWTKPEVFNPSRFLDDGEKFNVRQCPAFVPFGVGRRACLGEKLALTDLFFIVARLLQATKGMTIEFPDGPESVNIDGNPELTSDHLPHPYKIVLKPVH